MLKQLVWIMLQNVNYSAKSGLDELFEEIVAVCITIFI